MPDRELLEQRMRRGFRRDPGAPTARLLSKQGRNRAGSLSLLVRKALCPTTSAAAVNALRSSQSGVRQNTLPTRASAANAVGAASRSAVGGQHLRMKFAGAGLGKYAREYAGNCTSAASGFGFISRRTLVVPSVPRRNLTIECKKPTVKYGYRARSGARDHS